MNPLLSRLQPYPFERLRQLFADVTPNPALRAISLGMGEPKHATPAFIREAMMASVMAIVLSAIYCMAGIFFFWKSTVENQLAGAVMLGNMNNVLVIVFSSRFFGPVETLVAAMYIIPFFGLVIPLRYYYHRKTQAP